MKTGTTTIQCQLRDLEEKGILRKHGIGLLETESCRPPGPGLHGLASYENLQRGQAFVPNCLMKWTPTLGGMPECWNVSYYRVLHEASQNHSASRDFIISNEILMRVIVKFRNDAALFVRDLANSLREAGNYRLEVIATYRHWHEWIASNHQQQYKLMPTCKPKLMKYPGSGGMRVPTLEDFVSTEKRVDDKEFVHQVLEFFGSSGHRRGETSEADVSVSLVNMHAQPSFVHNFFCVGLPATMAPAFDICGGAGQPNASVPNPKPNPSSGSDQKTEEKSHNHNVADHMLIMYDNLAIDAHLRGWLPQGVKRSKALVFLYDEFSNDSAATLGDASSWPMVCPSEEFVSTVRSESRSMLNRTLAAWKELGVSVEGGKSSWLGVNGWDEKQFEEELNKSFSRALLSRALCSIDSKATLDQNKSAWMELFGKLHQ